MKREFESKLVPTLGWILDLRSYCSLFCTLVRVFTSCWCELSVGVIETEIISKLMLKLRLMLGHILDL